MGYGSRALQLLQMYYEGKFPTMDESARSNHNEITSVSSEVNQVTLALKPDGTFPESFGFISHASGKEPP